MKNIIDVLNSNISIFGDQQKDGRDMPYLKVDITSVYYRFRFRDPRIFKKLRIPAWAQNVANLVVKGAKITMGKTNNNWELQNVMIPKKGFTKQRAESAALEIIKKIETK